MDKCRRAADRGAADLHRPVGRGVSFLAACGIMWRLTSTALWGVVSKVILKRMELTAKRSKADEAQRKMLVGLAHDRIIHLGMVYIERGCITQDEYENLQVYLYEPYEEMGGNGSARRVMEEVRKLPIR